MRNVIDPDTREAIVAELKIRPAKSIRAIAETFNMSRGTIYGIARTNGFTGMGRPA